MATYRSISSTETDADSPVTVQLMDALRQNPEAIAEGAAGAPNVVAKALDLGITRGTATTSTTVSDYATAAEDLALDDIDFVLLTGFIELQPSARGRAVYRLSSDGGSTWGSNVTIAQETAGPNGATVSFAFVAPLSAHNAIQLLAQTNSGGDAVSINGHITRMGVS